MSIATLDTTDKAMTAKDCKLLHQLEEIIQKEMGGFVRLGQALLEIRDKRLYRQTHKTFEAYCRDKWEFAKSHAYRKIASAQVMEKLSPIGDILPETESQARPLTTIDLEEVDDVWQECIERAPRDDNGNPIITAKHVQETVDFWKAADEDYQEPEVCEEEEECDAEEFDVDAAGGKIRDWLRAELNRWPEKCRDEAAHWIRQILETEHSLLPVNGESALIRHYESIKDHEKYLEAIFVMRGLLAESIQRRKSNLSGEELIDFEEMEADYPESGDEE